MKISKYITKERAKGFSDKQIRATLVKAGFGEIEIDANLTQKIEQSPGPKVNVAYLIAAIVLVIVIVSVVLYTMNESSPKPGIGQFTEDTITNQLAEAQNRLASNPDNAAAQKDLAMNTYMLGNNEDALVELKKALELLPDDWELHQKLGQTYRRLGDLEKAELSLEKSLVLNPNEGLTYMALGQVYQDLGDYDTAMSNMNKAIEMEPDNPYHYWRRAMLYEAMDDIESAKANVDKALTYDFEFKRADVEGYRDTLYSN